MSVWQPMEMAPVDGTQILVAFINSKGKRIITCARWKEDGWRVGVATDNTHIYTPTPVLWAPIPVIPD